VQGVQPGEIGEAPIQTNEAVGLRDQYVKHVDLVHLAIRDMDKRGDIAPGVKQGMEFDGGPLRQSLGRTVCVDSVRGESFDKLRRALSNHDRKHKSNNSLTKSRLLDD
jgi:hypothetical protein